ncbi:hypothetical protein B0H14DRAFT_3774206 [Mycena olivaceomarginata]|nr:hypothetical protein B0H14DRAFT_3774206 [Mycena olivaceomarginata]
MLVPEYGDHEFQWLKKFGPVYRLKGCFGIDSWSPILLHCTTYWEPDVWAGVDDVKSLLSPATTLAFALLALTKHPTFQGLFIRALDIKTLKISFCSSPFTSTRFSSPALLCPVFFTLTLGGFGSPSSDLWLPLNTGSACSAFRLPPTRFPADIPLRCKAPQPERPIPPQTTHTPLSPPVGVADTQHTVLLFLLPSPPSSYAILEDVTTLPYDNIPLLNALIKETMRLYSVLPLVDRFVVQDTVIPLADPVTTSTGERMSHISVQKGQHIIWGIASYQRPASASEAGRFYDVTCPFWLQEPLANALGASASSGFFVTEFPLLPCEFLSLAALALQLN